MNEAIIEKFKTIISLYKELKGAGIGFAGVSPDSFEGDVHLSVDALCREFPDLTVSNRRSTFGEYPWRLFAEVDGVRFFAIATNAEYETVITEARRTTDACRRNEVDRTGD